MVSGDNRFHYECNKINTGQQNVWSHGIIGIKIMTLQHY